MTSTIATITDFEAGVDHLEIDLRDTHDIDRDAHSLRSVETEETAESAAIRMIFDAVWPGEPDGTYELVATIFLNDTFGVDAVQDMTVVT